MDQQPGYPDRIFIENDVAGSFQRCEAFLRELAELSGQDLPSSALELPVLELPMLDVITVTSLEPDATMPYLLITVILPDLYNFMAGQTVAGDNAAATMPFVGEASLVWDESTRRHVVLRKITLDRLPDTSTVMDEIASTADSLSRWHATL